MDPSVRVSRTLRRYAAQWFKRVRTAATRTTDPSSARTLVRALVCVNVLLVCLIAWSGSGMPSGRKEGWSLATVVVVQTQSAGATSAGKEAWRQVVDDLADALGAVKKVPPVHLEVWLLRSTSEAKSSGQKKKRDGEKDEDSSFLDWSFGDVDVRNRMGWYDILDYGWQPRSAARAMEEKALFVTDQAKITVDVILAWIETTDAILEQREIAGVSLEPAPVFQRDAAQSVRERKQLANGEAMPDWYLYRILHDVNIFAPASNEGWLHFRRWFFLHRYEKFLWPLVHNPKTKQDAMWNRFQGTHAASWQLWFSRFGLEHDMFFLYPATSESIRSRRLGEWSSRGQPLPPGANDAWTRFDVLGNLVERRSSVPAEVQQELVAAGRKDGSKPIVVVNADDERSLQSWVCSLSALRLELPRPMVFLLKAQNPDHKLRRLVGGDSILLSDLKSESRRAEAVLDILKLGRSVLYIHAKVVWRDDFLKYLAALAQRGAEIIGSYHNGQIANEYLYLQPSLGVLKTWREVIAGLQADRQRKHPRTETMINRLSGLLSYGENFTTMNPIRFAAASTELALISSEIGCIHSLSDLASSAELPSSLNANNGSEVTYWLRHMGGMSTVPDKPTTSKNSKHKENRKSKRSGRKKKH